MNKKIIVFAPHPDDETWGCGGTIAKKISEGYEVLIVIMTDGRYAFLKVLGLDSDPTPEELKEIRKEEVKRATAILGVPEENLIFLDFIDGTLEDNGESAEEKVIEIIRQNIPVEVYIPYNKDMHPDHRATYQIVSNSIKKAGISTVRCQYSIMRKFARIGPYIDTFLGILKNNTVRVDISKFLCIKEAAVEEFKSGLTIISNKQQRPLENNIKRFLKKEETFYIDK